MAEPGKMTVEVDVVIRSVTMARSCELPAAGVLARAWAKVDGWDWENISPATRSSYGNRADELLELLGSEEEPTGVCEARTPKAAGDTSNEPEMLVCARPVGHGGWHMTDLGTEFTEKGEDQQDDGH